MRKLIKYMLANLDLPETFDELRKDTHVDLAAVSQGVTVEKMAMLLNEERFKTTSK